MKTTKTSFEFALLAQHGMSLPFERRIFGKFKATGLLGMSQNIAFEAGRYAYVGSPLSLQLWISDEDGKAPIWEPYLTLTSRVSLKFTQSGIGLGCICVKTSSENAHMRASLLETGFFEDTGQRIEQDFDQLEVWSLTHLFEQAFDAVLGEDQFA